MDEYRKKTGLNPYIVPIRLRHLLPLVRKWAIENDQEKIKTYREATAYDRLELGKSMAGKTDIIKEWLAILDGRPLTAEAKSFYLMLKLIDETDSVIDSLSNSTELLAIDSLKPTNVYPQSAYYGKARIVKIPRLVRGVFGLILFIVYFIIFGKL